MAKVNTNKVESIARSDLNKKAERFLRLAEKCGAESDYLFITTFQRYQVQLNILDELENSLKENGMLVTKQYVKGRENLYSNPAIQDYNRTTDSANKTVATLMRILKQYGVEDADEDEDPLMSIMSGGNDDNK